MNDDDDRLNGQRVTLRGLQILSIVAKTGSMARAASVLGISQPAVSTAVGELEKNVGVRLVDRGARGVSLTPYGEALLFRGRAAFDELNLAFQEIDLLQGAAKGEVRVACSESIAAGIVGPVVERLVNLHPGITVHVEWTSTDRHQFQKLYDREADLIVARLTEDSHTMNESESLTLIELFIDRFCIAASQDGPIAQEREISPSFLARQQWVIPPLNTLGSRALMKFFKDHGVSRPDVKVTTFSLQLRMALVRSHHFLTAMPLSVIRLNEDFSDLAILPVELEMREWGLGIAYLKERTLLPAARAFIDCAKELVAEKLIKLRQF